MSSVTTYDTASTSTEIWPQVLVRYFLSQTSRHQIVRVCDDGRIAVAVGSNLAVLHPPFFAQRISMGLSSLRTVVSASADPADLRKDTMSGRSHLAAVAWASHSLVYLDGSSALAVLRPKLSLETNAIPWQSLCTAWKRDTFPLNPPISDNVDTPVVQTPLRQSDLRLISHTRLYFQPESSSQCLADDELMYVPYLICAGDTATDLYPFDENNPVVVRATPTVYPLRLHHGSTISVACIDGLDTSVGIRTPIAVASPAGVVNIYLVFIETNSSRAVVRADRVWVSSSAVPRGPITSMSWSLHGTRPAMLSLALSSGNNVLLIDWRSLDDGAGDSPPQWPAPHYHFIPEAHDLLVTGVALCADGTVASAGMDGRIVRWHVPPAPPPDSPNASQAIAVGMLHDAADRVEPVMALDRAPNGLGIVTLTTSTRPGHEVAEADTARKYGAAARRSLLQLDVLPSQEGVMGVDDVILACVDRLANHPAFLARPMTVWDAAHFVQLATVDDDTIPVRLCARLRDLATHHFGTAEPSQQRFVQRARALLWLARVIDAAADGDDDDESIVTDNASSGLPTTNSTVAISATLRKSLLYVHYARSLVRFVRVVLHSGDNANDPEAPVAGCPPTSREERCALASMCQFIGLVRDIAWTGAKEVEAAVRATQGVLGAFVANGEQSSAGLVSCAVCACMQTDVPLVADGASPDVLWCGVGHSFVRCVRTGMPVDVAVAIECGGCSARAIPVPEEEFLWVVGRGRCAVCGGGLVHGQCEAG